MRKLNLTGLKIGRLTVIKQIGKTPIKWECVCECGNHTNVIATRLGRGVTKSCGCLAIDINREALTTHGMNGTRVYSTWCNMMDRCNRIRNKQYKDYGGRGIKVCEQWCEFEKFFQDMGNPPAGYTLERTNNEVGYSPDNCVWATRKQQARNKRTNRFITINGVSKPLSEWAEVIGISHGTLSMRLKRGWSIEKSASSKLDPRGGKNKKQSNP